MTDAVFVRARPGLILAGIPPEGVAIHAALAAEWTANRMVVPGQPASPPRRHMGALVHEAKPTPTKAPVRRRRRKAATAARKRSSK